MNLRKQLRRGDWAKGLLERTFPRCAWIASGASPGGELGGGLRACLLGPAWITAGPTILGHPMGGKTARLRGSNRVSRSISFPASAALGHRLEFPETFGARREAKGLLRHYRWLQRVLRNA